MYTSRVSLKTIFVPANDRGISSSMEAIIRVINYSTSLFLYSRGRVSQTLRSHLASRYYISIYRSIYLIYLSKNITLLDEFTNY